MFKNKVKYSGTCGGEGDGSNLKWTLTNSGILTISGRGKMQDDRLPWSMLNDELHKKIKSVVLKDGITHIGNNAFYFCETITGEVIIPDTVKSVGAFAFYECSEIDNIKLPSGLQRIESYAFRGCTGWKEDINLPETITFIGDSAFENCKNLTGELHFSDNLTDIGRCAFIRCKGLTGDLILPDSLEVIGDYTFSECENINGRLKLPKNLKIIEADTFSYTGFTGDLVIPESVTEIGGKAFNGCKNFNGNLTLGNDVREIKLYAFYQTNFQNIEFGSSLEAIGSDAFACNSSLTGELNFPESLKYIGNNAFNNCPNVNSVSLPEGIEVIADKAFLSMEKAGNTITVPESVWYAGKFDAAFKESCFTDIVYKGERESDKEYHVKYSGEPYISDGLHNFENSPTLTRMQGMGDMAFVWIPKGKNLIGFNRFSDTWLDFENDVLHIYRSYRNEEVKLADIPVKQIDFDNHIFKTDEPFEYKGYTFQEFKHVRIGSYTEVCIANVKDENGDERILLFGDFTEDSDGMWNAYKHMDELMPVS